MRKMKLPGVISLRKLLADAERDLAARRALDVLEVDENALRGLGAQIHLGGRVLGHALMGLEHEVELADIGKVALAAARAGDLLRADEGDHLVVGHGLDVHVGHGVLGQPALDELVGAVAHLAGLAVDERVIERRHVAGSHPDLRVHEDGGIASNSIVPFSTVARRSRARRCRGFPARTSATRRA